MTPEERQRRRTRPPSRVASQQDPHRWPKNPASQRASRNTASLASQRTNASKPCWPARATNGDNTQIVKRAISRRGLRRPARSINAIEPAAPATAAIRASVRRTSRNHERDFPESLERSTHRNYQCSLIAPGIQSEPGLASEHAAHSFGHHRPTRRQYAS